jgi:hypothetical protein
VAAADASRLKHAFADERYAEGGPAVRMALVAEPDPAVLLAAHHGALDGLGLLALLGVVLGEPVRSSAKGLGDRRPAGSFAASAGRRLAEALVAPPARVAPSSGTPRGPGAGGSGDLVLARDVADADAHPAGTAAVVAAAVRAIEEWNAAGTGGRRRASSRRIVIAVGASRRPGTDLSLEERSAYLRIRPRSGGLNDVRAALYSAAPEPAPDLAGGRPRRWAVALAAIGARALSARLGSTLLVSNLGLVTGPDGLRSVAFHPVAHGRSGLAVGAATVGGVTTLTVRARRRDFDPAGAQAFLVALAAELTTVTGSPGPSGTS